MILGNPTSLFQGIIIAIILIALIFSITNPSVKSIPFAIIITITGSFLIKRDFIKNSISFNKRNISLFNQKIEELKNEINKIEINIERNKIEGLNVNDLEKEVESIFKSIEKIKEIIQKLEKNIEDEENSLKIRLFSK